MKTTQHVIQTRSKIALFVSTFCCFYALLGMPSISEGKLSISLPPLEASELLLPSPGGTLTFTELKVAVPAKASGGELIAKLLAHTVTNHRGTCLNEDDSRDEGDSRAPDLALLVEDNPGWTQDTPGGPLRRGIRENMSEAIRIDGPWTIVVRCYDNAAYGELEVTTTASHGNDKVSQTIPRDDNENKIGDGWEDDARKEYDGNEDAETGPDGNGNPGDGLTIFQEYRGLKLAGQHWVSRFSPDKKEFFVKHTDSTLARHGCGNASGLPFACYEIDTTLVNVNKPAGERMVYPIKIYSGEGQNGVGNRIEIDWFGDASGKASVPGYFLAPTVTIHRDVIQNHVRRNPIDAPFGYIVGSTISHEIGHCVNLNHCPATPVDERCIMNPYYASNQNAFGEHHNADYDLVDPYATAQPPAADNSGGTQTSPAII